MIDGGIGISAVVSIGSKFIERSKFTARHDVCCDKEADKVLRMAERFDRIPQEDVDHFEFQEYNMLHSQSMHNLHHYRGVQEEYKCKEWFKEPLKKLRIRGRVREAKRGLQSSSAREELHLHDLETYSRANSSCGSSIKSHAGSDSGLDLERFSRPYRTDSCSIRAMGGSPPSASLEDICFDEKKAQIVDDVSIWLASGDMDIDSTVEGTPGMASLVSNGSMPNISIPVGKFNNASEQYHPTAAHEFQCRGYGECHRVFPRRHQLRRHIRKHIRESRPLSRTCTKDGEMEQDSLSLLDQRSSNGLWPIRLDTTTLDAQAFKDITFACSDRSLPLYATSNKGQPVQANEYSLPQPQSLGPPLSPSSMSYDLKPTSPPSVSSSDSRRGSDDPLENGTCCSCCHALTTPLGPGDHTTLKALCKVCRPRLQRTTKLESQKLSISNGNGSTSEESDVIYTSPRCSHCYSDHTSVWQRSKDGELLCNPCGIFDRMRGSRKGVLLELLS